VAAHLSCLDDSTGDQLRNQQRRMRHHDRTLNHATPR
jgi:hypothetical protein